MAIIGSGIAAERLTDSSALILLVNALVTGAALAALVMASHALSGAHLNPAVSLAIALRGGLPWRELPTYVVAQIAGGMLGAIVSNISFGLPPAELATGVRSEPNLWLAEFVATLGLLAVIGGTSRGASRGALAASIGAYVGAAIWFTSSTAFANPAVTIGRSLSDTFTGIRPADVVPFVAAQLAAAFIAAWLAGWLDVPAARQRATPTSVLDERRELDAGAIIGSDG